MIKYLKFAFVISLFSIVNHYSGEPRTFNMLIKKIERCAVVAKIQDEEIPKIVQITCPGTTKRSVYCPWIGDNTIQGYAERFRSLSRDGYPRKFITRCARNGFRNNNNSVLLSPDILT